MKKYDLLGKNEEKLFWNILHMRCGCVIIKNKEETMDLPVQEGKSWTDGNNPKIDMKGAQKRHGNHKK